MRIFTVGIHAQIKMTESMHWCLLLLINVLSRLSSGTEKIVKTVCPGDAVQLFRNVAFINGSLVSIYINGDSQTMIATGNSLSAFSILPAYKEKMFLDEHGTFWIRNIQLSDEQKYILRYQTDILTTKDEVQISVMVPPKKHCRPKLFKTDSTLIASLELDECGKPSASVKWLEYPGISYIDKSMLKLPSGKESGTYYACAETPAQTCVTDLKISDYCSSLVVEANTSPAVSSENAQLSSEMIFIIVIVIIVLIILSVVITILVLQGKRLRGMSYFEYCKQGNFRPDRGNDVANKSLKMESAKCVKLRGQAAPTQMKIKKRLQLSGDYWKMEHSQGQIRGTGGVFIPLLMPEDTDY